MRCWYTRWKLSSAIDDGGPRALAGRGHAARCARCGAFARSLAGLHARLELGAGEPGVPRPAPTAAARPVRWPIFAGGAAVAAASVALVLRAGAPATEPAPPGPIAVEPAPVPSPGTEPAAGSLRKTAARVSRAAAVAEASLEGELRALLDDGARGVGAVLASGGLRE